MSGEISLDLKSSKEFLKNNWQWMLLILIVILGAYYRFYHVDYPVIGYHNWKETHYLTEARNFAKDGFFANGFFMPAYDYPKIGYDPSGVHSDTFPTTSIIVGLGFMIFGDDNLFVARSINILMILASIVLFYLIIKKLFKSEELALMSAFIMALNPLLIFFGRQVQLINSSMFFGMLGIYFYLKWIDKPNWPNTIVFAASITLSVLTKYSFGLFVIPMFIIFPFKKLKDRKLWKKYGAVILIGIIGLLWLPYSTTGTNDNIIKQVSAVEIHKLFESSFWNIMKAYAADNYTLTGVLLAGIGLLFFLLNYKKNRSKQGYQFFMFYFLGSILWFIVMAYKLSGHNYHQYPLAPLMIFLIAYMIIATSKTIANIITGLIKTKAKAEAIIKKSTILIVILIFILIIHGPSIEAKNRMFNTQFFGLDVAGEYIKQNKLPGDRVIHSSHQAYGLLWHGDIKGTGGIPSLEDIKYAENNLGADWIFIYNWDFGKLASDRNRWQYIADNYRIVQIGFSANQNQLTNLYYFLMRKNGSFNSSLFSENGNLDMNIFSELVSGKPIFTKQYEMTTGSPTMQYVNLE